MAPDWKKVKISSARWTCSLQLMPRVLLLPRYRTTLENSEEFMDYALRTGPDTSGMISKRLLNGSSERYHPAELFNQQVLSPCFGIPRDSPPASP